MLEHLRQRPVLQRRSLVERTRLHLDQRQIMQRIRDEHAFAIAARMPGDLLAAAQDHDHVDEALHHNLLEAVSGSARSSRWCGSARARSTRPAPARFSHGSSGTAGKGTQRYRVCDQPLTDGLRHSARRDRPGARGSMFRELGVQRIEACSLRDRRHEVGARAYFTRPSTLPLSLPLPGRPKRSANR